MIPLLTEFNPFVIPWQGRLIVDIRKRFNYTMGTHEVLLSGAVGSAKSSIMAHLIVTHCLMWSNARALVARRSLPDLKSTIWSEIIDHIEGCLKEGDDYKVNRAELKIVFKNGSIIMCKSFADGRIRKFRSLILSMAIIEELTENDDGEFYKEIRMRVGRAIHIPEHLIVCATNPDAPDHWAYNHFMMSNSPMRHVYYSVTSDNPFLPASYIEGLKETLSEREARRMLYGEWIEITRDVIYYSYKNEINFRKIKYSFNQDYPLDLFFDFNIAVGKPMSAGCGQYIDGEFHIWKTFIIQGARTEDLLEDMDAYGLFNQTFVRVFGDASGKNRDTRSIRSDYDIIEEFLRKRCRCQMMVPRANPPIRKRHNLVNAACMNANGKASLFVYEEAEEADKGLRLTKLLKNARYVEDDSYEFQHITTAIGYWIVYLLDNKDRKSKTIQL